MIVHNLRVYIIFCEMTLIYTLVCSFETRLDLSLLKIQTLYRKIIIILRQDHLLTSITFR